VAAAPAGGLIVRARRSRIAAGPGGILASATLAGVVVAASEWQATASPSTIQAGVANTVAVRVTDTGGSGDIGCAIINTGSRFTVSGASVTGTSADSPWAAAVLSATTVRVGNTDGNGKLKEGDWVQVALTVRGSPPGSYAWQLDAYQNNDCSGAPFLPTLSVGMTVVAGQPTPPPATPAPTPTSLPATPRPTPAPPAPEGSAPAPVASGGPVDPGGAPGSSEAPAPSSSGDLPTSTASVRATPSASVRPSPGTSAVPMVGGASPRTGDGSGQDGGGVSTDLSIVIDGEATTGLALGALGLLGDTQVWFVPGAAFGVPGILLIGWVVIQAGGAFAWIPAIRRLRGADRERRQAHAA
jgi:hypothetical protein